VLHVKSQVTPLHVALAFAGAVQGVQLLPQVATLVLLAQALLHAW
jgi:hypothetical protein